MSEESSQSVEFIITTPDGKQKKYNLKYALWIQDMALSEKLVDPTGLPNTKELWIQRIQLATGIDEKVIRKMPYWEMSTLITKWNMMNDVNPYRFLGEEQEAARDILSSYISQKPNSTSQKQN